MRHALSSSQRSDTLNYIHSMLAQLRNLAEADRHHMLTYLIDMAYMEAGELARGERASVIRKDKRNSAA